MRDRLTFHPTNSAGGPAGGPVGGPGGSPVQGERYESIPRKPLLENFRNAPLQAINLLNKEVRIKLCQKIELNQVADEERRAGVIKEELALLREVLPKMVDNDGRKKRGATGSNERKEEKAPPCPDISPALLGPLVVDQSLTTMDKVNARPTLSPSQTSCCRWRESSFSQSSLSSLF